ncbi:antitoxin of toxin-antitoxin stability system [Photorhabdus luminescens]|uniref:Antitoxin of toxin-antitoxin stability system n=1 Tax=Photorhabdus luminescens subsp. mexicana TaxID=2100167 RepID=A0A4V6P8E3_PHOLU|nr:antitoxin of toxin-antitoxin stability system [Photorhabdus luminescens]TDB56305.1 antitoxin of toxin-antitoxin stability system [Photorhabdus luminescens subsp. mexicana]
MGKQVVFTMKLESDLRDHFMAATAAEHRPASQVVRELMHEYVQRHKYRAFLQEKVDIARQSVKEGNGVEHSDVKAIFAARREQVKARK